MMVFNVLFKCRPGMRDAFLEAVRAEGIPDAVRAEPGNICYDWYVPADGGDRVLLVEKYADIGSVADHVVQDYTARLVELEKVYVDETVVERFSRDG